MKITRSSFKLSNGYEFDIYHNLPDKPGLWIQDALVNWLARTKVYTDWSFVKYIRSKNLGFFVQTEDEFKLRHPKEYHQLKEARQ